jgi:pilus assembly protein CpaB
MKRALAVIAAIVLAAVGTFVVLSYARNAEARALAGEETIEVLVATEAIAQGTPAQDIAESQVEVKLIPAKIQTPGSISDREQLSAELKGKVTSVDLVAGEQLLVSRFVDPQVMAAQSDVDVPEGLLEVTVSLDPQRALGGKLTPGETVAVLASFDPFDLQIDRTTPSDEGTETEEIDKQSPNTTGIILHKILVTDVQLGQASSDTPVGGEEETEGQPEVAPEGSLLVTLAMDAPSVERFVFTQEHGRMWLAGETEDDSEAGTQVQTRLTVYGEAEPILDYLQMLEELNQGEVQP